MALASLTCHAAPHAWRRRGRGRVQPIVFTDDVESGYVSSLMGEVDAALSRALAPQSLGTKGASGGGHGARLPPPTVSPAVHGDTIVARLLAEEAQASLGGVGPSAAGGAGSLVPDDNYLVYAVGQAIVEQAAYGLRFGLFGVCLNQTAPSAIECTPGSSLVRAGHMYSAPEIAL